MKFCILILLLTMTCGVQAQKVDGMKLRHSLVSAYDERVTHGFCGLEWPTRDKLFCGWSGPAYGGATPAAIEVLDTHTGKRWRRFGVSNSSLKMMDVSRNGERVAGVFEKRVHRGSLTFLQNEIYVWDVHTAKRLALWKVEKVRVRGFAFSPDGRYVAAGGGDGMTHIWRIGRKTEKWKQRIGGDRAGGYVVGLAFSPGSTYVYSWKVGGSQANGQVWSSAGATGKTQPLGSKISFDIESCFALSPRADTFFVGHSIQVYSTVPGVSGCWVLSQGKRLWGLRNLWATKAQFSSDGRLIALDNAETGGSEVRIARTGHTVAKITSNCGRDNYPSIATAFSPDNNRFAVITSTGSANRYAIRLYAL